MELSAWQSVTLVLWHGQQNDEASCLTKKDILSGSCVPKLTPSSSPTNRGLMLPLRVSRLPFDELGQRPCSHTICTASQAMAAHLLHPHHSRLSEQVQGFTEAENARFYLIIPPRTLGQRGDLCCFGLAGEELCVPWTIHSRGAFKTQRQDQSQLRLHS